ncbi:hypothetical protein [Gudongella oleilytica]|uniref:TDE2712 family protein n=1 Tax=Gudongella oleilytica TaxID=1582259 RepID=UPI002A365442|nr:hypothetical protein [Gudongella oleilytica]MDY0256420.1 hypothetical protein [Gudongella oleilytica]
MANIKVRLDVIEFLIYFWETVSQKEKVADRFFHELADNPDMQFIYDDEFTKESVVKVLSAITNRELLNSPTKKESRFWSQNMRMIEDLDAMRTMVYPVKTLNMDHMKDKLQKDVEVVFLPDTMEEYRITGNTLVVNFFRIMPGMEGDGIVKIEGMDLVDYLDKKVLEI